MNGQAAQSRGGVLQWACCHEERTEMELLWVIRVSTGVTLGSLSSFHEPTNDMLSCAQHAYELFDTLPDPLEGCAWMCSTYAPTLCQDHVVATRAQPGAPVMSGRNLLIWLVRTASSA